MASHCRRIFDFNSALVRLPGRSVVHGLSTSRLGAPTFEGVLAEHAAYVNALRNAGIQVDVLPALEDFPDSVFLEDPALVFSWGAIVLRSGAHTRAGEAGALKPELERRFETVLDLRERGAVDGGDILVTSKIVLIGLSGRTDRAGALALAEALGRFGTAARAVQTSAGTLHFKSACSLLDEHTVLATPALAASGVFDDCSVLVTPEGEEAAANLVRINEVVLIGSAFPRTQALLHQQGFELIVLDTDQIGRLDAGLSCMSLRWWAPERQLAVRGESERRSTSS